MRHGALLLLTVLAVALMGCAVEPEPVRKDAAPAHAPVVAVPASGHVGAEKAARLDACRSAGFPTKWDRQIEQAARRYLPHAWNTVAPCGWRAQLAAESGLDEKWCHQGNPHGTSASCLAQIVSAAAQDIERRTGITDSRINPQSSIRAGAFYLAAQRAYWKEQRSPACRRVLSVASYHGGAGTIIAGQRAARDAGHTARCYDGLKDFLPRHGDENRAYVERVQALQQRMAR